MLTHGHLLPYKINTFARLQEVSGPPDYPNIAQSAPATAQT